MSVDRVATIELSVTRHDRPDESTRIAHAVHGVSGDEFALHVELNVQDAIKDVVDKASSVYGLDDSPRKIDDEGEEPSLGLDALRRLLRSPDGIQFASGPTLCRRGGELCVIRPPDEHCPRERARYFPETLVGLEMALGAIGATEIR